MLDEDAGGQTVDTNRQSCWGENQEGGWFQWGEMMLPPNSSERNEGPHQAEEEEQVDDESGVTESNVGLC